MTARRVRTWTVSPVDGVVGGSTRDPERRAGAGPVGRGGWTAA
ncbi:hypothetical protein [Streptomyces fradiae]